MLVPGAANPKRDQGSPSVARISPWQRLNRLAASPWAIAFISFALTALIIRLPGVTLA